jgi:hypothetical protein
MAAGCSARMSLFAGGRHDAALSLTGRGGLFARSGRRPAAGRARSGRRAGDACVAAGAGRPFDLMDGYALPIPLTVIAELLGIPHKEPAPLPPPGARRPCHRRAHAGHRRTPGASLRG